MSEPGEQRIEANADAAAGCLVGRMIWSIRVLPTLSTSAYTCPRRVAMVFGSRMASHHLVVMGRTQDGTG